MLHGAVVPEHQIVRLPYVAVDELGADGRGEQFGQQRPALVLGQADDAGGEVLVHEQRAASRLRVRTHHRMDGGRHLGDLRGRERGAPGAARAQLLVLGQVAVLRAQRADHAPQGRGQRVVGGVLVGEQRVAALAGQLLSVQQRTQARPLLVRQVRMPVVAGIAQPDRLAAGVLDVGDDEDFRMVRQLEVLQHVDLQRPEAAAEVDVLARRDALVAEHHHVVVEVRLVQPGEVRIAERSRQVQPQHLGAQRRAGQRPDVEALRRRIVPWGREGFGGAGQDCGHGAGSPKGVPAMNAPEGRRRAGLSTLYARARISETNDLSVVYYRNS